MSGMNSVNDRLVEAEEDAKYSGQAIGYVTTNVDPDGIGRIQVRIPNVLDTDQGEVPWCLPTRISPFGQGPGYGVYGSPKLGSPVRVSFQNGDPHYPIYESDEYLKAHANPKFKTPDTWGFKDPGGSELFVNMTTGQWEFTHQSGTFLKYDGQGNVVLNVVKDSTTTVGGNEATTIQGTLNFTVVGDVVLNAQSNVTANITGNLDVDVGGTTNISSSGAVNITGSTVNLN